MFHCEAQGTLKFVKFEFSKLLLTASACNAVLSLSCSYSKFSQSMYENVCFLIRWVILDQIGLNWIKLDQTWSNWIKLDQIRLNWFKPDQTWSWHGLNFILKLPTHGLVLSKTMNTKMLAVLHWFSILFMSKNHLLLV